MPSVAHLVGVPFVNGGRDPRTGLDCWGLARAAFALWGVDVGDYAIDCRASSRIDAEIDTQRPGWVRLGRPEAPCLVVMRTDMDRPDACNHTGVVVRPGWFLHTLEKHGAYLERLAHPFWSKRIEGFYRHAG